MVCGLSLFVASVSLLLDDIHLVPGIILMGLFLLFTLFSWKLIWMCMTSAVGHISLAIWWLYHTPVGVIAVIPIVLRMAAITPLLRRKHCRKRQVLINNLSFFRVLLLSYFCFNSRLKSHIEMGIQRCLQELRTWQELPGLVKPNIWWLRSPEYFAFSNLD